jgi:Protein of unknown function (DUF2934)
MQDEERIRQRAHDIWEREGRPEGRHAEHWARARREVAAEGGPPPGPAGSDDSPAPTAAPPPPGAPGARRRWWPFRGRRD